MLPYGGKALNAETTPTAAVVVVTVVYILYFCCRTVSLSVLMNARVPKTKKCEVFSVVTETQPKRSQFLLSPELEGVLLLDGGADGRGAHQKGFELRVLRKDAEVLSPRNPGVQPISIIESATRHPYQCSALDGGKCHLL